MSCFLNSLQNMSVSAFVYKVTQNWGLSTRLNGQVVPGVPVRTACLKPAGTKRAGVDPRDAVIMSLGSDAGNLSICTGTLSAQRSWALSGLL